MDGAPMAELRDVIRATGLGTRTDDGAFPPPEGLTSDDGAGDRAVDVRVADLDAVEPPIHVQRIESVNATGEAVANRVLHRNGLIEITSGHESENGAEALGVMEPGPRSHVIDDAGGPQVRGLIDE